MLLYSVLYGGSTAFLKLASFAVFLWLAHGLSVDDYAKFGLLYALQQGIATFALAGIIEAVVGQLGARELPEQRAQLFAAASSTFVVLATATLVTTILLSPLILSGVAAGPSAYICVLASGVLFAYSSFHAQIVRLDEKHTSSLLWSFLVPSAGVLGGSLAFLLCKTLQAFFIGTALGMLSATTALWLSGRSGRASNIRATGASTLTLLRGAIPFVVVALSSWLSGYGNNYVINLFFRPADVATFTLALSLCSIMLLITGALNQVWCPRFYQLIHRLPFEQVELKNKQFYRVLGLTLGITGGATAILFPFLMDILGGNLEKYRSITAEMALLFSGYVLLTPWWQCNNHFLSHGMGRSILKITISTSLLGLGALVVLMLSVGPIGIYIGFLAQMLLRSCGILLVARRHWPVRVSWSGVAGGITMIAVGSVLSTVASVPLASFCYAVCGFVVVFVFFREDVKSFVIQRAGQ